MLERVVFIGSKELGFSVLKELNRQFSDRLKACITVDDTGDSRSYLTEFRTYCSEHHQPLHILSGKCDISDYIKEYSPDICIVVGWYYLIDTRLLSQVKGGFIGVHNSLLPKYRGFAPLVWQLINGEKKVGFSVFLLDDGLDTGDIFYQEEIEISEKDYIADVLSIIEEKILTFFKNYYKNLLEETLVRHVQKETGASFCGKRVASDGKINWEWDSTRIYNFIRAQSSPYPGAYTTYKGKRIILWRAEVFGADIYGSPGQIGMIDKKRGQIIIICGENTGLTVDEIEVEQKSLKAVDYIRSLRAKVE